MLYRQKLPNLTFLIAIHFRPQIQTGNNAVTVIRVNDFSPFNTNINCNQSSSNNNIIYATNNNISTINSSALQSPSARLVRNRLNNSRGRLNGKAFNYRLRYVLMHSE